MIPKIIHYCWFGRNPLPKEVIKYIESWKKHCPDYEIIEWNEDNFDINSNAYVKEAYESRKWAFVTDYVRLYALYHHGGIYMDTDVEVLKPLDCFLNEEAFSGFEHEKGVPTGIMASVPKQQAIGDLLHDYDNRHFINKHGKMITTTNVVTITNYFRKKGLRMNNTKQTVNGFTMYPSDYFCPKDYRTLEITLTENTHTIHHFSGTWLDGKARFKNKLKNFLGPKIYGIILKIRG